MLKPRCRGPASPVQFVDVGQRSRPDCSQRVGRHRHKRYIIEAKGSGLAFFDYDHDGWLDIYLTNGIALGRNGRREKRRPRISTKIIATELSPTSPRNRAWRALAGRPASAWATTTTTDGMTCSAVSGDTTFCSTTTANGTFTDVTKKAGVYNEANPLGSGLHLSRLRPRRPPRSFRLQLHQARSRDKPPCRTAIASANGRAFRSCAARAAFPATPTFFITTMATERLPMSRRRPAS